LDDTVTEGFNGSSASNCVASEEQSEWDVVHLLGLSDAVVTPSAKLFAELPHVRRRPLWALVGADTHEVARILEDSRQIRGPRPSNPAGSPSPSPAE